MTQLADSGTREWNPRYVLYAAAHGQTPEAMLAADRVRYPGGRMAGYMIWHSQQLRAFRAERPECFRGEWLDDHDAFNTWLAGGGA